MSGSWPGCEVDSHCTEGETEALQVSEAAGGHMDWSVHLQITVGRANVSGREQGPWGGQGWFQGAERLAPATKRTRLIF